MCGDSTRAMFYFRVPGAGPGATGIHSQCIGFEPGGEVNLVVATQGVADSCSAEPDVPCSPPVARGAVMAVLAEPGDAHTGRFCCSMYCLTTESGAPPTVPAK